jgi:oligopeptide/dipeptide ABC transporter ATP-binding protein
MNALKPQDETPVLSLNGLGVTFGKGARSSMPVRDVTLALAAGEILGLVGESGSGKSLSCRSALRLLPRGGRIFKGAVRVNGRDVLSLASRELRALRALEIGMIFQNPFTSLNPTLRIGTQLKETLRVNLRLSHDAAEARALELLSHVEIARPDLRLRSYPHELSGGMRQRVMIALAIAAHPRLLIADEPTTALDVSTQAQVLSLLARLRDETGMAILLVSHDFDVVAQVCDRIVVMYGGYVVEAGTIEQVCLEPGHPYTAALLAAIPRLDSAGARRRRHAIPGPPLGTVPYHAGCPFVPRCSYARSECGSVDMRLMPIDGSHVSACPFERARKSEAAPAESVAPSASTISP